MNFSHKLYNAAVCFILLFSAFVYEVCQSNSAGVFRFYILSLIDFAGWLNTITYLFCHFLSLPVFYFRFCFMFCCGILAELLPVLPKKTAILGRSPQGGCKESGRKLYDYMSEIPLIFCIRSLSVSLRVFFLARTLIQYLHSILRLVAVQYFDDLFQYCH